MPQYPIESVDNALKVLLLLGEHSELRLTDVSEYLGVASSTAHRVLAMLQYRGFVRQNERTKHYGPGTALTGVAFSILQRFDFRTTLRPVLERLHLEFRETVHLGMLDGSTVRFIDALESPRAVRVTSRLGMSLPASSTSMGKALLAQMTPAERVSMYPNGELDGLTEHSLQLHSELEAQVAIIQKRGYAINRQESELEVATVAVAFPPHTAPARLAVNVAAPINRMSVAKQRRIGNTVRALVEEAAALLPGAPPTG
ncbi:IclR family transcriptional regulator [Streptomyces radicis]|uniref:IclR family transcriptional regulator n=1 Tax=Streptomyces radicis TaxID=1750517 RepID=A0A3A9VRU6_9ACTN|nr:IclR family transcriptional regulator [Streptomyces radicis]RKN13322.1 IclR family transcriptional regulator [Streptomyces radicis]